MRNGWLPGALAIAALATLCVLALGSASPSADASGTGPTADRRGVDQEPPWVELIVDSQPRAYRRATLRVIGVADSPLALWAYEDPQGRDCAAAPAGRPPGTRALMSAVPVEEGFVKTLRPKVKPGRISYCAYLGPDAATASDTSFTRVTIRSPLLRAAVARGTVARALRRHKFADRVVDNLERKCRRRSRSRFSCRFSSEFPGYSLSGRGFVELKARLNYRFVVRVQGDRFTLTDENEGRFPG